MINTENSRKSNQKQAMKRIEDRDECPFCLENLKKEHKQPILKEGDFWLATLNQWPYEEAALHILLICKFHAETLSDLSSDAGAELIELIQWVENQYSVDSGGVCMRFGNVKHNGATVAHLHVHLLQPEKPEQKRDYEPIKFFVGAKK